MVKIRVGQTRCLAPPQTPPHTPNPPSGSKQFSTHLPSRVTSVLADTDQQYAHVPFERQQVMLALRRERNSQNNVRFKVSLLLSLLMSLLKQCGGGPEVHVMSERQCRRRGDTPWWWCGSHQPNTWGERLAVLPAHQLLQQLLLRTSPPSPPSPPSSPSSPSPLSPATSPPMSTSLI